MNSNKGSSRGHDSNSWYGEKQANHARELMLLLIPVTGEEAQHKLL